MHNSSRAQNTSSNFQDENAWLTSITGSQENPEAITKTFYSQKTLIKSLELQDLKIRGFSEQEIGWAARTLQKRNITPTYSAVSQFLDSGSPIKASALLNELSSAVERTLGVQSKAHMAQMLSKYAGELNKQAATKLDQHYASLWPGRDKIVTIVNLWPVALREQAEYIIRHWPDLKVKGDMVFNFASTSKVCSNHYGDNSSPLGYLAFFRLIKDIWFDAIKSNNTCTMNRVSHLLISFTKGISNNSYVGKTKASSRKEQFINVIERELKKGISSTFDIGAFAFLLVTNPSLWPIHKDETLKLMISRAFNSKVNKLAPLYSQWQNPARQDQTCKTVEAEVIPEVAVTFHYLVAIHDYLMNHKSQELFWSTLSQEIANGDYIDSITNQLVNPIKVPDWKTLPFLPAMKESLSQFYANPSHQKLFLGTEEFKAYQRGQRRIKARRRFIDAIKNTIERSNQQKSGLIKKQFKEQGFEATRDAQGNISYGEEYYKTRLSYISDLKMKKQAVEQHVGVPIPFKVTALQLNQILGAFAELPTAEQRYWKMSHAYAESTAIPELLADLTLMQDSEPCEMLVDEHEKLKQQQSTFITCRCSECTICETTRYLCECRNGLNRRIAKRENRHRDGVLTQRIIKSSLDYFAKKFCTEGTPVLEQDSQVAIFAAQTQDSNEKKRTKKRKRPESSSDISSLSPSAKMPRFEHTFADGSQCQKKHLPESSSDISSLSPAAKMPRFEHTFADGSQCQKKHLPDYLIERDQRKFIAKVTEQKVYSTEKQQRRHQRSAEPAGQRKYNNELRQLYNSHADKPLSRISTVDILDWFNKHPKQAATAVDHLQGKPQEVRSLFMTGTLEFKTPVTFKAIPCQMIYHDIKSFNKHLYDLAAGKDNNFVPVDLQKVKGLYLHKTFCLACRTNFGQKRELKAHLKATHQATMEKTFESIRAKRLEPTAEPALIDILGKPGNDREPQAVERIPFDQQSQMISALFEHLSV